MSTSRREFLRVAATATGLLTLRVVAGEPERSATLTPPEFSVAGGRYERPQQLLLRAGAGTTIHYTLDGTRPTTASPVYRGALTLGKSVNVTAIAVRGDEISPPAMRGYLIKKPGATLSVVVLSDIHTSVYDDAAKKRWRSHFDTLHRFAPNAQILISNGDQINDNHHNTGSHHKVVRRLFEENIARLGLQKTEIAMVHGNHDDSNATMVEHYPKNWYPGGVKGFYEKTVANHHFLITDTEAYSGEQREWLKARLAALNAADGVKKPIIVLGHRPLPGTVYGGAQSSNKPLYDDLAAYPQVIFFSGHSHFLVNDDSSIHQKHFTSVNEGSMSYTESSRNLYQTNAEGYLLETYERTAAQGAIVDIYPDRVEIERLNFYAEDDKAYTGLTWTAPGTNYPAASAGTLAGPGWTIAFTGSTPEALRQAFAYTDTRNKTAPRPGAAPTVIATKQGPALRIPQAADDRYTYGYEVSVTDAETGENALPLRKGAYVDASFHLAPVPDAIVVPLRLKTGRKSDSPVVGVKSGRRYKITVVAVDSSYNRSTPVTLDALMP